MRTNTLVLVLLFFTSLSFAQNSETNRIVGLNLNVNFNRSDYDVSYDSLINRDGNDYYRFTVSPEFSKRISDDWFAGVAPFYGYELNKSERDYVDPLPDFIYEKPTHSFGVEFFARRIIKEWSEVFISLEPSVSYRYSISKSIYDGVEDYRYIGHSVILGLSPVVVWQFSERMGLKAVLPGLSGYYTHRKQDFSDGRPGNIDNNLDFNYRFDVGSLGLGFEFYW